MTTFSWRPWRGAAWMALLLALVLAAIPPGALAQQNCAVYCVGQSCWVEPDPNKPPPAGVYYMTLQGAVCNQWWMDTAGCPLASCQLAGQGTIPVKNQPSTTGKEQAICNYATANGTTFDGKAMGCGNPQGVIQTWMCGSGCQSKQGS